MSRADKYRSELETKQKILKKSVTVNYTKEQNETGATCNMVTFTEKEEKKPKVIFNL